MTFAPHIRIAIAAVTCAAVAAPAAVAAGEPKNQPPFTRPVGVLVERHVAVTTTADPAGEPKNQVPFTRAISSGTSASAHAVRLGPSIAGEPKNDAPFVRSVSTTPVLVQTSDGFDWGDAGVGAIAVLILGCVILGAVAAAHRRPRANNA